MLSSSFAATKSDVFGAGMQKLFRSDHLIDAGAGGIERQSASPRIGIITPAVRYPRT
jgi:hypothetical protein